jgi:hypothetical protein
MATVYKKISVQSIRNQEIPSVSANDKTKVATILGTFVNLFKAKHLS